MSILLIDNYDSFTFNLYQLMQTIGAQPVIVERNDALSLDDIRKLAPSHIVLSPGPGTPAKKEDFGVCADVILQQDVLNCPVLGVCLGHQGIVHYLGGRVDRAGQIVHGKVSDINVTNESSIFAGIGSTFKAMRYHSLVALDEGLPADLTVTARESVTGAIMAIQHKTRPLYGVQFHPESIGTACGEQMLRNFLC